MKVSEQWLRENVNPSCTRDELVARLSMAGLEVDGVEKVSGHFDRVVIGKVLSVASHPSADKLKVCQVEGEGSAIFQVVCGAANVRAGLKVPLALVGATLPSKQGNDEPMIITQATLRGVDSAGMLCAASELGIDLPQEGLWELPGEAPIGQDLRKWLGLDDVSIEVDLTPNRGDCLSLRGLAREVAALTGASLTSPLIDSISTAHTAKCIIDIEAPEHCPRYAGRLIKGVNNRAASPAWLQERLRRCGIRSINPVVDITNYVMLELGQPMHAFDFNKLHGKVKVRLSNKGEKINLLDGQSLSLNEGTLLIADESQPLALAGIMGGAETGVSGETTDILLEAAFFTPTLLAGKARLYGLHTDSSYRFERGVDFSIQELAIERATGLLSQITGGVPGPLVLVEAKQSLPELPVISLRLARIQRDLGLDLDPLTIKQLLGSLGLIVVSEAQDCMEFRPPPWRYDLRLEVDLLEEIARLYGYNKLPTKAPRIPIHLKPVPESYLPPARMKERLVSLGYREVVTYSFVDPVLQAKILLPTQGVEIPVMNPISSEMSVMRRTLLPGLISSAIYNTNRQQSRIRIFEAGMVFEVSQSQTIQKNKLGILLQGSRYPESWFGKSPQLVDFYDIKGDIEGVLSLAFHTSELSYQRVADHEFLHPGQSSLIAHTGKELGWFGRLHPQIEGQLKIDTPVFVGELDMDALKKCASISFSEVSRYPEVRRDLAILVDRQVAVAELISAAKAAGGSYLINLKVFDVYSGEGIDTKRKSVGLGLTFQTKSRTLTESEIGESVERVLNALRRQFAAELRS